MKHYNLYVIGLLTLLLFGPLQGEIKKGLHADFYWGQSFINPSDLNSYSTFQTGLYDYYYDYYNGYYNDAYNTAVSDGIVGEFGTIKNSQHFGGRLTYFFDSGKNRARWGISLGLRYFHKGIDSDVGMRFNIDSFYSGVYTMERYTDLYNLYVEGYVPQLGLHFLLLNQERISIESYLAAGITFTSTGSFERRYYKKAEPTGYVDEYEIIYEYDGRGNGLALDAGIRINLHLLKSLAISIEGGYSFQRIQKINGDAIYTRRDKDGYSDGYSSQIGWSGDWVLQSFSIGTRHEVYYQGIDEDSISDFNLNLSGFYLRIGLRIKLF